MTMTQTTTTTSTGGSSGTGGQPADGAPTTGPAAPPPAGGQPAPGQDGGPADDSGQDGADAGQDGEQDDDRGGNREAARRRVQLRETQQQLADVSAERDALGERLAVLQRAEVERLAGGPQPHRAGGRPMALGDPRATEPGMASAADLWTAGVQLADLLDDAGNVDPGKVGEAVAKVLAERPHWRESRGSLAGAGIGAGGASAGATSNRGWSDVLRRE